MLIQDHDVQSVWKFNQDPVTPMHFSAISIVFAFLQSGLSSFFLVKKYLLVWSNIYQKLYFSINSTLFLFVLQC